MDESLSARVPTGRKLSASTT